MHADAPVILPVPGAVALPISIHLRSLVRYALHRSFQAAGVKDAVTSSRGVHLPFTVQLRINAESSRHGLPHVAVWGRTDAVSRRNAYRLLSPAPARMQVSRPGEARARRVAPVISAHKRGGAGPLCVSRLGPSERRENHPHTPSMPRIVSTAARQRASATSPWPRQTARNSGPLAKPPNMDRARRRSPVATRPLQKHSTLRCSFAPLWFPASCSRYFWYLGSLLQSTALVANRFFVQIALDMASLNTRLRACCSV
jgi:hypothetical protein